MRRHPAMPRPIPISSENLPFLDDLYEQYRRDPSSVDPAWRALLDGGIDVDLRPTQGDTLGTGSSDEAEQIAMQARVDKLIENYRLQGHLAADLDPLGRPRGLDTSALDPAALGLDESCMDRLFNPGTLFPERAVPLRKILERLRNTYCRHIGVEYWQIADPQRRAWLRERMESVENQVTPPPEVQRKLLRSLARADNADHFLHNKFLGAKRFSIAGGESLLALLETLIDSAGDLGAEEVVMGMAHRGRLAVMMNILGKTPEEIFSEFEKGDPWANLGSGDVKYHKGSYRFYDHPSGRKMYLALAFNPSHLEAITPVIGGRVRAKQDHVQDTARDRILGVTMHGDSAIAGQGVFAETLNLSRLPGYTIGGTIRIVIDNQVGFTTEPQEARSTIYCTAVADMINVPIFHVNGDDPEAAAYVAELAVAYRQRFHTDVVIDLVCYRKYGHNEGDEPTFTQPLMYKLIRGRKSVRELYQERLIARHTVTPEDCQAMDAEIRQEFEAALAEVRKSGPDKSKSPMHGIWEHYRGGPEANVPEVPTAATQADVDAVRAAVTTVPEGFHLHPKLGRLLKEVDHMLAGEAPLSWAAGEYMAYGSLLRDGHPIRLSGQDAIRGTFNHRHAAWFDTETGERYFPLAHLAPDQPEYFVFNSPLSEFAVLGFEFGYTLAAPYGLCIWEAQFGDFANGAQVILDQFISSSEDKWNRISGLTLFLPHGYEGQGPEHSSARLERFLQLCAEDNMQVCNLTTPAQMFHVLRRQVLRTWRKPLVLMTPKSLLRKRESFSPLTEFTTGRFHRVLDDDLDEATAGAVRRVLLCSGRLYYDLLAERERGEHRDTAIVRVEQLYPFPAAPLTDILARYPRAQIVAWVQDEPKNMGAWTFVRPRIEAILGRCGALRYVGRKASASPATGTPESHKLELEMILQEAFDTEQPSAT